MDEQKRETVVVLLHEMADKICDNYCKYPERYPEGQYGAMLDGVCSKCPLGILGI